MKVRLEGYAIVLRAEDPAEHRQLERIYAGGHVHLVCKALVPYPGGQRRLEPRVRTELWLTPSVIRWQRPRDARAKTPASRGKTRRPARG